MRNERAALLAFLVIGLTAIPGLAAAQGPRAGQMAEGQDRTQWWNDPMIVQEVSLTAGQRSKMDGAYEGYTAKLEDLRKNRGAQLEFLEALEKGDWDQGRKLLQRSSESMSPQVAMGELKLEVLPLLSAEQREKLLASYPRVIKRQWRPAVGWSRTGGGKRGKPFQGAGKPPQK